MNLLLSCESTIDLPYTYAKERNLYLLHYTYSIDEIEYLDDMGKNNESLNLFYKSLNEGKLPKTNKISVFRYLAHFEKLLKKGDVLHIAFGSSLTQSYKNAKKAQEILMNKYPNNELVVVDSCSASAGYGLIVDTAADMRDNMASIEEIEKWILSNSL